MVRYQQAERLNSWLAAAKDTALIGFADGLVHDLAAIGQRCRCRGAPAPVEGQISHLKTIKRTMCGRAKFDLLRHAFLRPPEMVALQPGSLHRECGRTPS